MCCLLDTEGGTLPFSAAPATLASKKLITFPEHATAAGQVQTVVAGINKGNAVSMSDQQVLQEHTQQTRQLLQAESQRIRLAIRSGRVVHPTQANSGPFHARELPMWDCKMHPETGVMLDVGVAAGL